MAAPKAKANSAPLRERIRHVPSKTMEFRVEDWGETITLRPVTVAELDEITADDRPSGSFAADVVIACCIDPATGDPLFTAADAEWIVAQPTGTIAPIVKAINDLSGLGDADAGVEAGKGD